MVDEIALLQVDCALRNSDSSALREARFSAVRSSMTLLVRRPTAASVKLWRRLVTPSITHHIDI